MLKRILLVAMMSTAVAASASTITFTPASQTINLGASTTVNVNIAGLALNQVLGAFDFLVTSNSSIITPTSIVFFSSLGDPSLELTGFSLLSGSIEAAETSFETSATLLALQSSQPFSLIQLTYLAVGAGTSSLNLGASPEIFADGTGAILANPTVNAGSITVVGSVNPSPVPEPSTFALLGSGLLFIMWSFKRRQADSLL